MRALLGRLLDLRDGEARPTIESFVILAGVVAAHTILETARDALFLSKLPPERLALVYALVAVVTLAVSELNARFTRRFGKRNALVFTLVVAAYGTVLLGLQAMTPLVLFALYAWSALVGTLLGVQFWMFAGQIFTVAQGKRLFGPIASGGVAGAVAGAGFAALALSFVPVGVLLFVSAGIFLVTALFLTTVQPDIVAPPRRAALAGGAPSQDGALALLRREPYLRELAAFVGLSTAAVLVTDYLFKSVAAQTIPPAELGRFFARTYAALNALSLGVQLFIAGRVLRRLGVVPALVVLPLLLLAGGGGVIVAGGLLALALFAKGADGALRYSLHRVAGELLWMPLAGETRDRGKALLDSVFGRAVQAVTAGGLLLLAAAGVRSPRALAVIVVVLAAAWLLVVARLRRSYLDLFRQALARGTIDPAAIMPELDLSSVETVMEALSSREARRVLAAMELLHEKGRARLIPGLILYHESAEVLLRALRIITTADRADWPPLAERLLSHPTEGVRIEALRCLAKMNHHVAVVRALEDESPTVRAHAAFWAARDSDRDPLENGRIRDLLDLPGRNRARVRAAFLDAVRDAPDARFTDLVIAILEDGGDAPASRMIDGEHVDLAVHAAHAMTKLRDPRFIPVLIPELGRREGRHVVHNALVHQGEAALDALVEALRDPRTDSRLRIHLPQAISRFTSQRAADVLAAHLTDERSGAVRFKSLRGLGHVVTHGKVKVDEALMTAEARKNLVEHFRLLSLSIRVAPAPPEGAAAAGELLRGLLADKMRQSLERAFRLLQIVHPTEDIHGAYLALRSGDKRRRAQVMEFLDTLTMSGKRASTVHRELREALRLVADDLADADRVARIAHLLSRPPHDEEEALAQLLADEDDALATIAGYYALAVGSPSLAGKVAHARAARAALRDAISIDTRDAPGPVVLEVIHGSG
ncbi:MAG: Npt1/Npt2 family nucleotide transporter [Minicystis sp.]